MQIELTNYFVIITFYRYKIFLSNRDIRKKEIYCAKHVQKPFPQLNFCTSSFYSKIASLKSDPLSESTKMYASSLERQKDLRKGNAHCFTDFILRLEELERLNKLEGSL